MNTVASILPLVPELLRTIATAAQSFLGPVVSEVMSAAPALIESGDAGAVALNDLTLQIKGMIAAGRDPTEAEWNALKARSDAAHAVIQDTAPPPAGP